MTKTIVCLFLLCFLFACQRMHLEEEQSYTFEHIDQDIGNVQFTLKNNGRFSYEYSASLVYRSSAGTWRKAGKDSIVLVSDDQYKTGYIAEVTEKEKIISTGSLTIIDEQQNEPIGFATVIFDEDQLSTANENGVVTFPAKDYDKVKISFLDSEFEWLFKEKPSRNIEFRVNLLDVSKSYFDHEVWILKNRKLISPSGTVFKYRK